MNAVEIEEAVSVLAIQPFDPAEFAFQFLEAFGNKPLTLKRLRQGSSNRTDIEGAVLQRSNIHILATEPGGAENGLKALRESPKTAQQKAKFILATDGTELLAEDLTSGMPLACAFEDLHEHFGFLLPLAGISVNPEIKNNPIDIKATGRLDKLYVELLQDDRNADWANEPNRERFNHFMAQLIFCFYAEDTSIFQIPGIGLTGERPENYAGLFTETVRKISDETNTDYVVGEIFRAMDIDTKGDLRTQAGLKNWADKFPYVNGELFGPKNGKPLEIPKFTKMARTYLLRAGELEWTDINPDIFGSMIQAVADDDERGDLGMHYTSVPNILKVLNPLFLDSLETQLDKAGDSPQQLGKLKKRMAHIRVFDPACGSGNFLVIAYKKMRDIEHRANLAAGWGSMESEIPVRNFRGIELKTFAAEIARLALIIAEYQCDEVYVGQKQADMRFLPLDTKNWITQGNALRYDWLSVFPPPGQTSVKLVGDDLFNTPLDQSEIAFDNEGGETYICGNPPYLGSTWQSKEQKDDLKQIFDGRTKSWKSLDYVAGWFMKGADYLKFTDGVCAFVSTNSICQGQQVPILWPLVFATGSEIVFAHTSFKWRNLASHNAGVTVAIIGLSQMDLPKRLFEAVNNDAVNRRVVKNINAYLIGGPNTVATKSSKPLTQVSEMSFGNKATDGGNLLLSLQELLSLDLSTSQKEQFIKKMVGSAELINGKQEYCIWVKDDNYQIALKIPPFQNRFEKVRAMRQKSSKTATRAKAKRPYAFDEVKQTGDEQTIIVPSVSSENRDFLPVGLLDKGYLIKAPNFALYDAPLWNVSIIASSLHIVWIGTVCGKLKTDYRYSNTMGWNTFPLPKLTKLNMQDLTRSAENILLARESHFPATIADLYKPDAMPENLRAAHAENDRILEEIYIGREFKNDTERLEKLFEMYSKMTSKGGT